MVQIVVEEKPQVTLYFEPRHPVSEVADANVTLMCSSNNLIHGRHFKSVKWYLDGDLLKQVDKSPECLVPNITKSHRHVDPSKGTTNNYLLTMRFSRVILKKFQAVLLTIKSTFHSH